MASSFRRFGASFGVCPVRIGFADPELLTKVLGQTHTHTNTHPTNVNFNPLRSKSSFLRMDFVHSSSLRFWTSGRHYFILPWVQNRNCLNQKIRKSKFRKFKILTPLIFGPPLNFIILKDLVTLHPCTKFGVPRSNGVCARGHKAEKRDCALRAQF